MNTKDIAEKLCEHCRNGTEAEALETLYSEEAQSVEAMAPEHMDRIAKGKEAIKAKQEWWYGAMDVTSSEVDGPYINDNQFAVIFTMEVTDKSSGKSWSGKEVAIYEVAEGQIVKETFFMQPMG